MSTIRKGDTVQSKTRTEEEGGYVKTVVVRGVAHNKVYSDWFDETGHLLGPERDLIVLERARPREGEQILVNNTLYGRYLHPMFVYVSGYGLRETMDWDEVEEWEEC